MSIAKQVKTPSIAAKRCCRDRPFWVVHSRYSSSCELVLAVKGQGVHGFTLDAQVGEFILTRPYMKVPKVSLVVVREAAITSRRRCMSQLPI